MEYCGGGAVSDLYEILDKPLTEPQIAYICRESLQVSFFYLYQILSKILKVTTKRDWSICTQIKKYIGTLKVEISF